MAALSLTQIASVAKASGLDDNEATYAVAIAMAESGGNPRAHNAVPPDNSYGLWQINMYGALGPERRQRYGLSNNEQLYDPATNARVMFALSGGGTNWRPWTTYTRGTYLRYMNVARQAVQGSPTTTAPGTVPVAFGGDLDTISKAIKTLTNPGTWVRIGLFGTGFFLALVAILATTKLDNKAVSLAAKVVPVGRAATAVKAVT